LNDLFEPGDRDEIIRELRAEGIGCEPTSRRSTCSPTWPTIRLHKPGDFPVTEYVSARTIGLPFFTKMTAAGRARLRRTRKRSWTKTLTGADGPLLAVRVPACPVYPARRAQMGSFSSPAFRGISRHIPISA
jgi:hypothetical protein